MKISPINTIDKTPLKSKKTLNIKNNQASYDFKPQYSDKKEKKTNFFQKVKNFISSKAFALIAIIAGFLGIEYLSNKSKTDEKLLDKISSDAQLVKNEFKEYAHDAFVIGQNSDKIYNESLFLIDLGAEDNFEDYETMDDLSVSFKFNDDKEPYEMQVRDEDGRVINKVEITKDEESGKYTPAIIYEYSGSRYNSYTFDNGSLTFFDEGCRTDDENNKTAKRKFAYDKIGRAVLIDINSSYDGWELNIKKSFEQKDNDLIYKENYTETPDGTYKADKIIQFRYGDIKRYTKDAKLESENYIAGSALDIRFEKDGNVILK